MTDNVAIDKCLGKRTRLRRTLLGMSQEQLGVALNITFQQFQKYERGAYGVSASRLWDVSQILDVPTSFFFEDMTDDVMKSSPRRISRGDERKIREEAIRDTMARRETLELVRTYYSITRPKVRKRISEIVKSIAVTVNEK